MTFAIFTVWEINVYLKITIMTTYEEIVSAIIVQYVLLMREISLKVMKFCEKVKFSNCDFCNYFRDNEWTYI